MTDYSPAFPFKFIFMLMIIALLPLLQGCAQKTPMAYGDISDRVWLRTSSESYGIQGFFTGTEGQLLLVNTLPREGIYWELQDDHLLLWFHNENPADPQSEEYRPLLIEGKLFLSPELSPESPAYAAETLQEPLSNIHYFPVYPSKLAVGSPGGKEQAAYLQLDTSDKSLRGYGGVNNFYGGYQRIGATGFKAGPTASTMMTGPRMAYEIMFMQCIEQADAILPVGKGLFLYQDSHLLCSFRAD